MKAHLDHLPEKRQRDLNKIARAIRTAFESWCARGTQSWRRAGRVEKIILFGSFATGSYTDDMEGEYLSDYDILVIVNSPKLVDQEVWWDMGDMFLHRVHEWKPEVNIIVHDLAEVNQKLADGLYFFTDIYEDGIQLFSRSGSKPLREPGPISAERALAMAEKHFEIWEPRARHFVVAYASMREVDDLRLSAFMLHQAIESAYACALLVRTNYMPATHNIKHLRSLAAPLDPRFDQVWPGDTKLARRAFQRIKRAYVEARYSEHYEITAEELDWASARATELITLVRDMSKIR